MCIRDRHHGRRLLDLAQPAAPRAAVPLTQPVLKEQPEMVVVGLEHPVVQGLPVVGIGPGLEQQPGQAQRLRVRRLVGAVLTAAERPGQRGERGRQSFPEEARIRVGARLQQQPSTGQAGPLGRRIGDAAETQVEQRRPLVRPAFALDRDRVRGRPARGAGRTLSSAP